MSDTELKEIFNVNEELSSLLVTLTFSTLVTGLTGESLELPALFSLKYSKALENKMKLKGLVSYYHVNITML